MVFRDLDQAFKLIRHSVKIFRLFPKLLVPLLITYVVYAGFVIWEKFFFEREGLTSGQYLEIAVSIIFVLALALTFSCSLLLEMLEQITNGKKPSLLLALKDTIFPNLPRFIPLVFIWTLLWFTILFIEAIFSRFLRASERSSELTPKSAALALAGEGRSGGGMSFHIMKKLVRMYMFLIMPAIAWNKKNVFSAWDDAINITKNHPFVFLSGVALTEITYILLFIPAIFVLIYRSNLDSLPDLFWFILMIYLMLIWSFSIYLEQMFCAQLYLWDKNWRKECINARKNGKKQPKLSEVKKPFLLRDFQILK